MLSENCTLYRLVYQSSAVVPFQGEDLTNILRHSRSRNAALGLTGLLLYNNGEILQVLEGPHKQVRSRFARIERDVRHRSVVKLACGPVQYRHFAHWALGFQALDAARFAQASEQLYNLDPNEPFEPTTRLDTALAALLGELTCQVRW